MRKLFILSFATTALSLTLGVSSCNNLEDQDYFKQERVENINSQVTSTSLSVIDYIQSNANFSKIADLFQREGIFQEMPTSGELHTVLLVGNENYTEPEAEDATKVARSHITNISVAPSKLNDGDRLLMWHNKYVTIKTDEEAEAGTIIDHTYFNTSVLKEVIKAEDGYIYVIDQMIYTPTSLEDYINALDETKYGRFKQMVLSSGGREFDRANSKVIGVDNNGNTLYDSVFIRTNAFFDQKGFSLSSEAIKATMLLFSDEVIDKGLREARQKLRDWGYNYKISLMRNGVVDSVYLGYTSDKDLEDWILKAAFFRNSYTAEELTPKPNAEDSTVNDFKSIYDIVWRTTVQELDLENPVQLSNGVVYEVKSFRIPNNRLIYRLHEEFQYYDQCTADQKTQYFVSENLDNFKVSKLEVGEWTSLSGVWPLHGNSPLTAKIADNTVANYSLDFTPLFCRENADGGFDVHVLMVPPGKYRMAMGFKQGMGDVDVQLFAVNVDGTFPCAEATHLTLGDGSTKWHYDRGATLSNNLPEYYDKNDERLTAGSKNGYYWTDGGPVYDEVCVPDLNEDGSPVQLLIRITGKNGTTAGTLAFNHWCLRPTANNY
ncbi:MAG: hypothetical protein J6X31_05375 [Bacteroidales bacterium]|nr:hypothetical protein [Bacteroidales bacterium]